MIYWEILNLTNLPQEMKVLRKDLLKDNKDGIFGSILGKD